MSVTRNLTLGIRWGFIFGAAYSLWAGVLFLLRGSTPFRGHNVTVVEAVATYLIGGVIAGGIVGILLPLTRWKLGAALVGMVAVLPVSIGVIGSMQGFSPWTEGHTFVVAMMSLLLGGGGGLILRNIFYED